jgi:tetratricopeptide (TPR) repeat protein
VIAPADAVGAQWFPRDPEFALRAGRELLARPDYPAALCYLQTISPILQKDSAFLFDLGEAYWGNGEPVVAVGVWEKARQAGDESDQVLLRLRAGYLQTREWQKAADLLALWLARHPDDTAAKYRLALIRTAMEPSGALELLAELQTSTGSEADNAKILATVIRAAVALGDPAYLFARTGEEMIRMGEPVLAESLLRRAIERNPEYGEAYSLLGLAQESAGEDPDASYRLGVQYAPDSRIACLLYGSWLQKDGQLDMARWWLGRAWDLKPGDWVTASALARVDFAVGNINAAEGWLQQAVQSYPEDPDAWLALAAFFIENDLRVEASGIPAARQALLLAPGDDRALDLIGWGWFKLGDFPEAERMLRSAIGKNPDSAAAHLHLGMCLLEEGLPVEAAAELQQAAQLDPQGTVGAKAREMLAGL